MVTSVKSFVEPGQMYAPDTQRRLAMAQALRSQGLQTPQGTSMGSGTMQRYAAPHWSQYAAQLAQGLSGAYMEHNAEQDHQGQVTELIQALRGTDSPEYVMQPGYEQPSQLDRLSALEDNPLAQQVMMNISMQGAAEPDWQKVEMNTGQGTQTGFVDMSSPTPEATFRPMGEPVAEEPGKLIQNEAGEWVPNPAWLAYQQAGAANVNVNAGDSGTRYEVGSIPQGYRLVYDDQGRPVSMEAVPGGPAALEQEQAAESDKMKQEQAERYADVVTEDIDRALNIVENVSVPVTGAGSYLSAIPGTPARDLLGLVDTIRANVGFDRLQQMRDASPTGGALGQVSELENRLLQATLGNLELSQSEEQFKRNLRRVKRIYEGIVHGVKDEQDAVRQITQQDLEGEKLPEPASPIQEGQGNASGGVPEGVDPEDWKYMTEKERALFR